MRAYFAPPECARRDSRVEGHLRAVVSLLRRTSPDPAVRRPAARTSIAELTITCMALLCSSGLAGESSAQSGLPATKSTAGATQAPAAGSTPTTSKRAKPSPAPALTGDIGNVPSPASDLGAEELPPSGVGEATRPAVAPVGPETPGETIELSEEPKQKWSGAQWKLPAAGESRSGDPELILTFDDGPHERYTKMVLDELAERHLEAIFFWVGHRIKGHSKKVEQRLALVRRAVREGHIVAAHGVDHLHVCSVSKPEAAAELDRSTATYKKLTGLPMVFFRIPYGSHCKRIVRMLSQRGLVHLHWDIDPMEWTDHDSTRVAATLIGKIRRLRGRAVLLMHDTQPVTVRALPKLLDFIAEENRRREKRGARPIHILSGSELALERLDPMLASLVQDSAKAARDRLGTALASLVP